jgi:hypothetical protein
MLLLAGAPLAHPDGSQNSSAFGIHRAGLERYSHDYTASSVDWQSRDFQLAPAPAAVHPCQLGLDVVD